MHFLIFTQPSGNPNFIKNPWSVRKVNRWVFGVSRQDALVSGISVGIMAESHRVFCNLMASLSETDSSNQVEIDLSWYEQFVLKSQGQRLASGV